MHILLILSTRSIHLSPLKKFFSFLFAVQHGCFPLPSSRSLILSLTFSNLFVDSLSCIFHFSYSLILILVSICYLFVEAVTEFIHSCPQLGKHLYDHFFELFMAWFSFLRFIYSFEFFSCFI